MRPPLPDFRHFVASVLLATLAACGGSGSSPAAPTPTPTTPPAATANISIASISVSGQARDTGGYSYRVVVHLKETGGVAATINTFDIVMLNGAAPTVSSHYEHPMVDGTNTCPAGGSCDSKELALDDVDAVHRYATNVQVIVTFTDSGSHVATASGSADVPAISTPAPPQPPASQTYTLSGVITDEDRKPITGARVEVLNGSNAGKFATTDATGLYTIDGLVAETFRLRASATDYTVGEQNVTVPTVPRADFTLRTTTGCAFTLSPNVQSNASANSSYYTTRLTRVSGGCTWQVRSNVSWIATSGSTSGTDSTTLYYYVGANTAASARTGTLTVSWNNGSADLSVTQSGGCAYSGASSTVDVGYTAGQFTYTMHRSYGSCTWRAYTYTSWLTVSPGSGSDGDSFTYSVGANPSNYQRYGYVYIDAMSGTTAVASYYLSLRQSAAPAPACVFSLSPTSLQVPRAGGQYTVTLTNTSGSCGWQVNNNSWVTFGAAVVSGSISTVPLTIAANATGASRTASFAFTYTGGYVTLAITQAP